MSKVTIRDAGWERMKANLSRLNGTVKVGVFSSAPHDGASGISMVELAAVHEFGSPAAHIPERSFLRRTFISADYARAQDVRQRLSAFCSPLAYAVITGKMAPSKALNLIGAWGAAEVKKTITAGKSIPPRLKPATIAKKKSSRALVDTGRLLASITWQVVS